MIEKQGLTKITIENDATAVVNYKESALGIGPAYDVIKFFKETVKCLPERVKEIETRLDGAYYNHELIKYLKKEKMTFTITGKLSPSIITWINSIPEKDWKPVHRITKRGKEETGKEWAEMPWTSAAGMRTTMRERRIGIERP